MYERGVGERRRDTYILYIYMHIYIHMYIGIYIYMYMYTYVGVCVYLRHERGVVGRNTVDTVGLSIKVQRFT